MARRAGRWLLTATILGAAACTPPRPPVPQPPKPAPTTKPPAPADDHTVTMGADVLVRQYGLSRTEALRQMRVQPTTVAAAVALQAKLGLPAGGVWIDHRSGGKVIARTTSAEGEQVATDVSSQFGVQVATVAGDRSAQEIDATADELVATLQADGVDAFSVRYDPATDAFAVDLPPTAGPAEEPPAEAAEDAASDVGLPPGDVAVDEVPGIQTAACTPDARHCDPPLRGATAMRATAGTSSLFCSAGFVGRTATSGSYVVVTAGHCAIGTGAGRTWTAYVPAAKAWRNIGVASGAAFGAAGDSSSVAVGDPVGWAPAPTLVAGRSALSPGAALSQSYRVQAVQHPVVGAVLCSSGASSGTSCGEVTGAGVTVAYGNAGGGTTLVEGLARIDLRGRGLMCAGDSGGPVYANALGFGLVSGGSLDSSRTIDNGIYRATVPCGSTVVYIDDVARAASRLGVLVGARDWRDRLGWTG